MMEENNGEKGVTKRKVIEIRAEDDTNDDKPIVAMLKPKSKRNPKKQKVGVNGEVLEDRKTELGQRISVTPTEDLGGMEDTLATYKKKLRGPRKNTASGLIERQDMNTTGVELSGQETCTENLKDEFLVVEKSKAASCEASHGTIGASDQCADEVLEDSLSAFMLKAQSGSTRKSRNCVRSKQLSRVEFLNDGLTPGSDCILEDQLPETAMSQSPLELMTKVVGFDSSLNIVSRTTMDIKCDTNQITKAQDTGSALFEDLKVELSSSPLMADSDGRYTNDRHTKTQGKVEDSNTVSFCQQSNSYLRSYPNIISVVQEGEVTKQICKNQDETKVETVGLDHCVSSQKLTLGSGNFVDEIKNPVIKKECEMGHGVVEISSCVSALQQVDTINVSEVDMPTGGFNHSMSQEDCKAIAKSEASCSDHNVLLKLEDNIKEYLNNDVLNKSYKDTSNETMKLISNELMRQSEFLSNNTSTFIEEKVVMPKPEEPKFASVSSHEEASTSLMLSPESPRGVYKQEITLRDDHFTNCKQSGEKPDSPSYHIQSSHDVCKGLSVLNCEYSGDEVAEKSSSPSTAPDCNKDYADDMGLVPDPKVKDKLSAQRTMRNTRKRRLWDMAYEGDADWHFLMHNENVIVDNQDEDENLVRRREKSKLSIMFSEAKDGRKAAVSSGLKARAASPLEKIRFKELLKRKGGLQMYLECRNHILGCWNKDVSRILPLSGCGVSATHVVNEAPDVSLIREIYAFLDQYAYINVGIACEKRVSASHRKYDLQVSSKENLGGKFGASLADLDDGVSFITGKCKNPDPSLEEKNVVLPDSESVLAMDIGDKTLLDAHALKSSSPTEPYNCDNHGQRKVDERESIIVGSLDNCKSEQSKEICHVVSKEINHQSVNPRVLNDLEVGKHIIVIGAGPAGLAAARHLQRQGFQVTVLEARGRIGGRVFTDRESLSVPVDLGASIITGVEADVATERRPDPSSLVCSQLGLELTVLNSDCPLYDTVTGDKVPADLDEDLESEFNSLLDDLELLVAQKGEDAMKMSLEEGLEFTLQRRRLVQQKKNVGTSNVHRLADDDEVLEDNYYKREILSPLERRVMDWHFAHLEYGCAASLEDVSLPYWNQDDIYGGFGGAHCMIKGGYSSVVEALGEGLCIHLNNVVTSITYSCKDVMENKDQHDTVKVSTSTGTDFFGDAVLITVPLGCLKKESIKFSPLLPQWKQLSIQRLGFGVLNKVILEFPEVFWDDNVDYFGATAEETNKRGHCFMFWNVKKTVGAPVLIALLVGKAAVDGQDRSSSDHVNHALVVLRNLFGVAAVPDPVASVVTDWGRDPYSYGAYSYVAIGSSGDDYDILGSPVENCLFFAGEATCKEHPDTVGGAMMSGLREAVRIMNILTTGIDCTAEVNAMEAAQRCVDNERSEVGDIIRRLEALQMSNTLYEKSLDGSHVITRKALLQDMFSKAKTTSGRLHLIKELLNFPARVLKSFAGTKEGLSVLNSWILDSLGKDGTQLLRHCVRLLTLVSTDLLAVRVSGIGKTIKEKVCLHTSRDIRAVASQLVNVWIEVFRKQKASNGGLKFLRHSSAMESSKSKYNLGSGKPPLRTPHGVAKMENRAETKSKVKVLNLDGSTGRQDSKMEEEKDYIPSEEEQAIIAAEEAARAAAIAAAKAYASSGTRCNTLQLPKIPSFNKYARGEHYSQVDESDIRTLEVDTRNCKVREWTADFSAAHVNLESSKRSVDNLSQRSQRSQRSYSNDVPSQLNIREHSADSATVDSTIFTKAWVDSAGSEGIKDGSAIDRWQSQAAAADSEFYSRTMRIIDEDDSNVNLKPPMKNHDGYVNERSAFQASKELVENQPKGPEKIKQAVVDYVASLLMPLYKDKKFDKDGYKSIMKKTAHKVMEQATFAERSMAVSEFLDYKRKNKIRAFVDMLIGRHMAAKPGVRS